MLVISFLSMERSIPLEQNEGTVFEVEVDDRCWVEMLATDDDGCGLSLWTSSVVEQLVSTSEGDLGAKATDRFKLLCSNTGVVTVDEDASSSFEEMEMGWL